MRENFELPGNKFMQTLSQPRHEKIGFMPM